MKIASYQPTSLIDMPGYVSCIIFCQGCNMVCEYCQNPDLLDIDVPGKIDWKVMMNFLVKRRNQLEAVIFSGGEPTIQPDLVDRIMDVRRLGYKVGLHTNGTGSSFEPSAPLCDYILLSHATAVSKKIAHLADIVELSEVVWSDELSNYHNVITSYKPYKE